MRLAPAVVLVSVMLAPFVSLGADAQVQPQPRLDLAFEVMSIKPSAPDARGAFQSTPGRLFARNQLVSRLIELAYGLMPYELIGAPEWTRRERYDIEATIGGGIRFRNTMQSNGGFLLLPAGPLERLLEDRFRLQAHREMRQMPVYRLGLARSDGKLGPGLRRVTTDCTPKPGELSPCRFGGTPAGYGSVGLQWGGGYLFGAMAESLGAPVIDATGLSGQFDIQLRWTRQLVALPDGLGFPDYVSLFTAVEDQLGLKLERSTGAVSVIVVDDVQRPTSN